MNGWADGRACLVAQPAGSSRRRGRPHRRPAPGVRARGAGTTIRLWARWREIDDGFDAIAALRSSETVAVILEPRHQHGPILPLQRRQPKATPAWLFHRSTEYQHEQERRGVLRQPVDCQTPVDRLAQQPEHQTDQSEQRGWKAECVEPPQRRHTEGARPAGASRPTTPLAGERRCRRQQPGRTLRGGTEHHRHRQQRWPRRSTRSRRQESRSSRTDAAWSTRRLVPSDCYSHSQRGSCLRCRVEALVPDLPVCGSGTAPPFPLASK